MKLLIDMNLSPEWVRVLGDKGFQALHWSKIGMPNAPDHEIMAWAKENGYILFTHDLDFGAILAATREEAQASFKFAPRMLILITSEISSRRC
jgi:predicted nuclease of predicted toxin-antitoxin system